MKYLKFLISPLLMGVLFILFAIAMASATFIENDFGSAFAYKMVYNTRWFELILLLLSVNLIGQLINFKLFRKTKITGALFHLSFLVMILGAGITRYFGREGSIHIREGEEQNIFYSNEKYIGYTFSDSNGNIVAGNSEKYFMTEVSADNYSKRVKIDSKEYDLILDKIIPNASEVITDNPDGTPVISLLVSRDMMERETIVLKKGDTKTTAGITFGFESSEPAEIKITADSGSFFISSVSELGEMNMMSQIVTPIASGSKVELRKMQVIKMDNVSIVPQVMTETGIIKPVSISPDKEDTEQNAFIFSISGGGESTTVNLLDRTSDKTTVSSGFIDGYKVELTYGANATSLPFSIKLNDFILERYPGSNSPSGYMSDVILIDRVENIEKPFMIFMNNILKYKGYRFYQSSYDRDEKGTILSVNHDMAGMLVTYSGYGILFVFIILSLINRNSVFHNINPGYWSSAIRKIIPVFVIILLLSGSSVVNAQKFIPDKNASEEFGKVLVQDQKGRTKPLFTLSNDILRKVTRENTFQGLSSMQVFLGLYVDFNNWNKVPLIKVSNSDIQKMLGIRGNFASFSDLVDLEGNGSYKIVGEVNDAYSKAPGARSKFDKEVMKIDERVNIVYMIYKGDFLKMFPLKDATHTWGSPEEALKTAVSSEDSIYLNNIIPVLEDALHSNNIGTTQKIVESIAGYQERFTEYDLPSDTKTNAELLYYKLSIFERLFPFYSTVGLIMLIGLITMVISGKKEKSVFVKVLGWLLFAGFLLHTFGLALRWYIAGHSPMSNGYESMIFISWVTLMAGFIFSRKSAFALSATAVLASMTLMVAHLSFMDPEITNLVPVLKSYWLTLHVSVITGSYGFLGLGAILSLITMVLLALSNSKNRYRISNTIDELTIINYKSLTLGLYFLTIGTFLGAVWANESWGRYWGWDPKETWSLITIVLYSIVVHSRMIPGMKDIFTFNLVSLFAFSGVLMTYFGVNYYLSGLHSYAAGDPVPVPAFVYITVILLTALAFFAYLKYIKWSRAETKK